MSEIGTGLQNATGIRHAIARAGYAFVEASDMRTALGRFGTLADWPAFADSWNDLHTDTYMADGGRYRRRRFGVYGAGRQGAIERGAHQPHYQTLDYNHLNGGVERWFEPIRPEIGDGASLATILEYCRSLFGRLAPETDALAHRGPSVPHRGEDRPGRQAHARGHAPRRRRLCAGAAGRPPQHRVRHDHDPRSRQARARQLHPDRPARLRAGRRCALLSRRDAGRAGESGPARLSRRAGGDVPEEGT